MSIVRHAQEVAVTSLLFPSVVVVVADSPSPLVALWEAEVQAAYSLLQEDHELGQQAYPSLAHQTSVLPSFRNITRHKVRYRDHAK